MPHRPQPRTVPPPSLRLSQHSPPSFRSPREGGWLFVRTCGQIPYCRSFCTSRHAPRRPPTYFTDTQLLNLHHLHLLPKHKQTFSCPALPLIVAHAHGQRGSRPWTTLHTPVDNVVHARVQRTKSVQGTAITMPQTATCAHVTAALRGAGFIGKHRHTNAGSTDLINRTALCVLISCNWEA